MLIGLSSIQLIEESKLSLDPRRQVYKLCPEIGDAKVLVGKDALGEWRAYHIEEVAIASE